MVNRSLAELSWKPKGVVTKMIAKVRNDTADKSTKTVSTPSASEQNTG
jgi:hypothetical protein